MSEVTVERLKSKLVSELQLDFCEVQDLSDGCGGKFHIIAVGNCFEGKNLIKQHRLVNEALAEEFKAIHALTLKTMTPEKYEIWKQQN